MDIQISIAAARVNAGLTQAEMAEKLGVSKATIVSWERGKTVPKINQFQAFCELCKLPMEYIFLPNT